MPTKPALDPPDLPRRQFGKLALLTVLNGAASFSAAGQSYDPPVGRRRKSASGIKLAAQISANPTDEDLLLVKQLGVEYVTIWVGGAGATYENMLRLRQKIEGAGLKVWNIGNTDVHNMEAVTLNLPGRDQKIGEYKTYLRNVGKVGGIHYTTYAHMGNGIWSSAAEQTRGGAKARAFDMAKSKAGYWSGKRFDEPLTHGRRYTEKELWDNFTYFIKAVAPVAEAEGIRIGIHPDDPPQPELGGVPRCIFGSFQGYQRALEIANSPNVGVCLCVGTWLEGGKLMGKDVLEAIDYFGRRGKLFKIHFRNVSAPLPHFVETFVDDGYMEMYQVMKALQEVHFDGAVIPDHVPSCVAGPKVGFAFSVGYMRALLERAEAEVRG